MEKLSPTVRASLELLRVQPGASDVDLKKSFYQLALLYHPDRNSDPQAPAQFRRITDAYELLLDHKRVEELNRNHIKERLHRQVIDGLSITFGSFFGYRIFHVAEEVAQLQLTGAGRETSGESKAKPNLWLPIEENNSILDHPAFDAIEVIYAGRLNERDEERLRAENDPRRLGELPWVILNNQGIIRYLDGDIKGSLKSYRDLCKRVPNNIIFTYRLGICLIIDGFQNPVRSFLSGRRPDPKKINEGLQLLRHCLRLGAERPVGRQNCQMIRKTLADVLEKLGHRSKARKLWKEILLRDEHCAEALYRVRGPSSARRLIMEKQSRKQPDTSNKRALLAQNPSTKR